MVAQVTVPPRSGQLDGVPRDEGRARAGDQASRDFVVAGFERTSGRRREKEDGKGMGSRGARPCSWESANWSGRARRWCGRRRGETRRWRGGQRRRSLAAAVEREGEEVFSIQIEEI